MIPYFKKIDSKNFSLPKSLDSIKGEFLFRYGAIAYFKIKDKEYLRSLAENFLHIPVSVYLVEAYDYISPHRDNGQDSCINFYLDAGGYTTKFWIPKDNAKILKTTKFDAVSKKFTETKLGYAPEDLILVDSFIANNNEIYCLNIKEIHSVEGVAPKIPRTFIQFQWNKDFDQLLRDLEI